MTMLEKVRKLGLELSVSVVNVLDTTDKMTDTTTVIWLNFCRKENSFLRQETAEWPEKVQKISYQNHKNGVPYDALRPFLIDLIHFIFPSKVEEAQNETAQIPNMG